jgi:hypothetical protein
MEVLLSISGLLTLIYKPSSLPKSLSLGPTSFKLRGILFTLSPKRVVKKLLFLSLFSVTGYPLTKPGR